MTASWDCIVFDLDGTLADPLIGFARSVNHALSTHGLPERSETELASAIGPPLEGTMAAFAGGEPDLTLRLVDSYRDRYARIGYAENSLYPGVADSLRALADSGVTLALCTAKRVDFAERILELFALRDLFSAVDGGEIGTTKAQQLRRMLEAGAVTRRALMVGDRIHDIDAARANGLEAAAVTWGYGSREELERGHPEHWSHHPRDWLRWRPGTDL